MPIPEKYLADFSEDGIYHVFNRTNNNELLFRTDENRHFFLKKYHQHLSAFIDTYAWCLLPTHFHLLVRVKKKGEIITNLERQEFRELSLTETRFLFAQTDIEELLEKSFKRLFQSYAQAFNKMFNRHGNLFYRPFKRIKINNDHHFTNTIIYIHTNPVKHSVTKDFVNYPWSSWKSILSNSSPSVLAKDMLEWFGGVNPFIDAHISSRTNIDTSDDIDIEDYPFSNRS